MIENFQARILGATGISSANWGIGTYRMDDRVETHELALLRSLESGLNLIDTSANYMDGHSEALVGKVLQTLRDETEVQRGDLTLISKGGTIQGTALQSLKKEGAHWQNMHHLSDDLCFCIDPLFLEAQLEKSLQRLHTDYIDFYLIHNPEQLFEAGVDETAFYRHLKDAFTFLEGRVAEGKIRYYGLTSNALSFSPQLTFKVDLEKVWAIAREINPKHHFKMIEVPLNLFENEAVTACNESGQSVLERAKYFGLAVVSNRPLNAFTQGKIFRLADFNMYSGDLNELDKDYEASVADLVSFEKKFKDLGYDQIQPFFLGHILSGEGKQIKDFLQWKDLYVHQIHPLLIASAKKLQADDTLKQWSEDHLKKCVACIEKLTTLLEHEVAENSAALKAYLEKTLDQDLSDYSLSQIVLGIYQDVVEVDVTLIGLRDAQYVEALDNVPMLNLTDPKAIFKKLNALVGHKNQR